MECVTALQLFKCLASSPRLQILKSLCKEDMYVERLAERLNLSAATTSKHLKKLEKIGAVRPRKEQYYTVYTLCPDVFSSRIIDLIEYNGNDTEGDERDEAYRRKILYTFMENGKVTKMPAQLKKKLVIIEEIGRAFEIGKPYTEKEVNTVISDYYEDFCMVRRFFVNYGLFTRDKGVYLKKCDKISGFQMPVTN